VAEEKNNKPNSATLCFSSENERIQKSCSVNMALIFIPLVCRASGMISSVVQAFFPNLGQTPVPPARFSCRTIRIMV
jgi:hypothetical protein